MFHLLVTIIFFSSKQCNGQLGYGGNGYCSTCTLDNSGSISRGFGFGGGNYVGSSSIANSDLASQNLHSLSTSNSFIIPNNGYVYGSNGYGVGTGYGNSQTGNNLNYGSPSTNGISWNNAYSSTGNYGAGSGYMNCYNNNCLTSSELNTIPSASVNTGISYGISGSNDIYSSSLPDMSYKTYSLPSASSVYPNLGSFSNAYVNNRHSGPESYSLPITYSSYPPVYGSYGSQGNINSLSNLFFLPNYSGSQKVVAADDVSGIGKSLSSSTSATS
ncbi:membrane-anchored cell surface protein [Loa loa]|uniref:Membrane-anchored cell surface protein n=1 Tax=Loa loa TaxID=7209 RepID=A0A1I7VLU6_LOALO|nr:membrane-anchored cell surface protein [Loa loa]EFO28303.2 membrane-anchored cell surface protein [Loa loa]